VTAITYAAPPHCYCSVTPGEIREFGIKKVEMYPLPPPPSTSAAVVWRKNLVTAMRSVV